MPYALLPPYRQIRCDNAGIRSGSNMVTTAGENRRKIDE
jgi:hypothetical protein